MERQPDGPDAEPDSNRTDAGIRHTGRRQLTSGHLQCRCGDQTDVGEPATAIYPLRTGRPVHATRAGQDGRRTTLADRRYDACHRDVPQHERCRRRRKETEPRYGSRPEQLPAKRDQQYRG